MYLYRFRLPSALRQDLTAALAPVIRRTSQSSSAASFMSAVDETTAACAALLPALQDLLPGRYDWFRIVGLRPSQQIVAHADQPILGDRYHLPIQTNAGCWTFHEGVWQRLEEGSVYRMTPTAVHGAVNWGETLRVHLLIDVVTETPERVRAGVHRP